jgi:hypothetical protein
MRSILRIPICNRPKPVNLVATNSDGNDQVVADDRDLDWLSQELGVFGGIVTVNSSTWNLQWGFSSYKSSFFQHVYQRED